MMSYVAAPPTARLAFWVRLTFASRLCRSLVRLPPFVPKISARRGKPSVPKPRGPCPVFFLSQFSFLKYHHPMETPSDKASVAVPHSRIAQAILDVVGNIPVTDERKS